MSWTMDQIERRCGNCRYWTESEACSHLLPVSVYNPRSIKWKKMKAEDGAGCPCFHVKPARKGD